MYEMSWLIIGLNILKNLWLVPTIYKLFFSDLKVEQAPFEITLIFYNSFILNQV